jgi:hypothetical protein
MTKTSRSNEPNQGTAERRQAPTYQDVLDESLKETFPASDPISPGAATRAAQPISTEKNATDWELEPVSEASAAANESSGADVPPRFAAAKSDELADIYHALKHGGGRESVNDANVDALIRMAMQYGDVRLEYLLREWRAPCGDDPEMPPV